jgi:hypothetical protein
VSLSPHLKTKINPISEKLFSTYLEFQMVGKVPEQSDSEGQWTVGYRLHLNSAKQMRSPPSSLLPTSYRNIDSPLSNVHT